MDYAKCSECPDECLNTLTGHCSKYNRFYALIETCKHNKELEK